MRADRNLLDKNRMMINHYSSDWSIEKYSKIGLWNEEELIINRFILPGANILELGCGGGRATIPIKKMGYNVIGIDVVSKMVSLAKKKAANEHVDVDFIQMDGSSLSFKDEVFDAVLFLYNGLESVQGKEKRERVLKEVFRILKKSGVFFLATQSMFNLRMMNVYFRKYIHYISKKIFLRSKGVFSDLEGLAMDEIWISQGGEKFAVLLSNPIKIMRDLKRLGFQLEYINSRNRMEKGKRKSLLSIQTNRSLFYIFRKK